MNRIEIRSKRTARHRITLCLRFALTLAPMPTASAETSTTTTNLQRCEITVQGVDADSFSIRPGEAEGCGMYVWVSKASGGRRVQTLPARNGEKIVFYVSPKVKKLYMDLRTYRCSSSWGDPFRQKFTIEQLKRGATWTVIPQDIVATLDVFVQTPQGPVPLTKSAWKTHISKTHPPRFLYSLWTVEGDSGTNAHSYRDHGQMDWKTGRIIYCRMSKGVAYTLAGQANRMHSEKLTVLEGANTRKIIPFSPLFCSKPVHFGRIVVSSEFAQKWNVSGILHDEKGQPIANRRLFGRSTYISGNFCTTGENGKFTLSLYPGTYELSAYPARGISPFQVTVTNGNIEINLTADTKPWPRRDPHKYDSIKGMLALSGLVILAVLICILLDQRKRKKAEKYWANLKKTQTESK